MLCYPNLFNTKGRAFGWFLLAASAFLAILAGAAAAAWRQGCELDTEAVVRDKVERRVQRRMQGTGTYAAANAGAAVGEHVGSSHHEPRYGSVRPSGLEVAKERGASGERGGRGASSARPGGGGVGVVAPVLGFPVRASEQPGARGLRTAPADERHSQQTGVVPPRRGTASGVPGGRGAGAGPRGAQNFRDRSIQEGEGVVRNRVGDEQVLAGGSARQPGPAGAAAAAGAATGADGKVSPPSYAATGATAPVGRAPVDGAAQVSYVDSSRGGPGGGPLWQESDRSPGQAEVVPQHGQNAAQAEEQAPHLTGYARAPVVLY